MIGGQPAPPNRPNDPARSTNRGQPGVNQITGGKFPDNPDQTPQTGPNRANQPTGGQTPTNQPTPPDQITGVNRGQTIGAKQPAPTNPTGPTNDPQTGQPIKPNPTPANPKQSRKRAFEVSTY